MSLLNAALRYTNAGLSAIPIWSDKRKNPHLSSYKEYLERLPTVAEWRRWAYRWPRANIGLITGYWRNLVALDFDDVEAYEAWADVGKAGQSWTVATGRGYHVYFELESDPGKSRMFVYQGHETLLRAKGGYCIAPPSLHHSGVLYRTVHKVPPLLVGSIDDILHAWQDKQDIKPKRSSSPVRVAKQVIVLEDLIEPVGQPNGRGAYQARCPFHQDTKPSAWLNVDQQRFGCNACWPGLWFDVVNVYARMENISNGEAYKAVVRGNNVRCEYE